MRAYEVMAAADANFAELKDESAQLQARAQKEFGKDDWAEFPLVKGYVQEAKDGITNIEAALAALKAEVLKQRESAKDAETSTDLKSKLEEISSAQKAYLKATQNTKKKHTAIRAAMKKHEKGQVKGVEATQPTDHPGALEGTQLMQIVNEAICSQKGPLVNVSAEFQPPLSQPFAMTSADLATNIGRLSVYAGLKRWSQSQMGTADSTSCSLAKHKHRHPFVGEIEAATKLGKEIVFMQPRSETHDELLSPIFTMALNAYKKGWGTVGLPPLSMSQWIVVVEGRVMMVAVNPDALEGHSYAKKREQLSGMALAQLSNLLDNKKASIVVGSPGTVVVVPAGWMLRQQAEEDSFAQKINQ